MQRNSLRMQRSSIRIGRSSIRIRRCSVRMQPSSIRMQPSSMKGAVKPKEVFSSLASKKRRTLEKCLCKWWWKNENLIRMHVLWKTLKLILKLYVICTVVPPLCKSTFKGSGKQDGSDRKSYQLKGLPLTKRRPEIQLYLIIFQDMRGFYR